MKELRLLKCFMLLTGAIACTCARANPSLGLATSIISDIRPANGGFPLVAQGVAASLTYDSQDFPGVIRAIGDLQADIKRVTSVEPIMRAARTAGTELVIIGTIGKNATIDALIASGKMDASDLRGKWESFVITTVTSPLPGAKQALVIAGSDKRGTIYGIYELSEQLGVSPWYWWADVAPKKTPNAYVLPGRFASGEPVVKYRGIFINDEAPCLTGWAQEKFGGLNSKFYTKVFELLLRLRANYLWPAMWDNAFNEDDPENPRLADEYGIVMGTSHHEPMMRAHKEWTTRRKQYGNGQWNYATNAEALQRFFGEGIARNKNYENLVTVGMRGDGDVGMASTGSLESDIKLLDRIFTDQRRILAEELRTDPTQVPQAWVLFTEVLKFYDNGLRPPEDVTLVFTDDNVGNLRRLPTAEERKRSGGAGIYYHIDMHGGPYSYQWINTNPFWKISEQMTLANEYGANRLWIVNVGDLKPLELPIEFFLRMAWNPAALNKDKVAEYTRRWAEREFGPDHAAEIADIVRCYTKYNGWRKPEQIKPDTFSQLNYLEAERVEAAWNNLVKRAEKIYAELPPESRDAFYQLVLHPTKASATVAQINIVAGRNNLYAKQGRASTNVLADRVRELFREDRAITDEYNQKLAGGKWNHLMDQPHLGQFDWEPPIINAMPAVTEVLPVDEARVGVAIEGSVFTWPDHFSAAVLPTFDSLQPRRSFLEVFKIGSRPIEFSIASDQPWIVITEDNAPRIDRRFWIEVDWSKAPTGASNGSVRVKSGHTSVTVRVPIRKATEQQLQEAKGRFASLSGPIAFAASASAENISVDGVRWEPVPDYGREEAAMAIYPVTANSVLPPARQPRLEYPVFLAQEGSYEVTLVLGPVMDFVPSRGMRIAIAFDDQPAQMLDLFANQARSTFAGRNNSVAVAKDNVHYLQSSHKLAAPGGHILKLSMVDPGIVIQKIIISDTKLPDSYFGPPENTQVR